MFKVLLFTSFIIAGFAVVITPDEFTSLWESWKVQHQKFYSAYEEIERFTVFAENVKRINAWNTEHDTPKLAINKFADLSNSEFGNLHSYCAHKETDPEIIKANTLEQVIPKDLPASVDWREKGAVTNVKDQGQCGACWAFTATGAIESLNFIDNGKLSVFSDQQIIDCDSGNDQGCGNGGLPYLAIQYASQNGLELDSDYPYISKQGNCSYDKTKAQNVTSGYKFVTANSTDALKAAVVNQPVAVGVEADQDTFQFYSSGIITINCGASLDHSVLVVGYHKFDLTLEAFIVKNSWGSDWGDQGYAQIWTYNKANDGQGVCGILSQPVVPVK